MKMVIPLPKSLPNWVWRTYREFTDDLNELTFNDYLSIVVHFIFSVVIGHDGGELDEKVEY